MRIAFFGASVTAQGKESGYFVQLEEILRCKATDEPCTIERFPFPACHLDDAGFFHISDVISANPSICFLEWNTTGLGSFNPNKLSFIIGSLVSNRILPVFLILPRVDTNLKATRRAEEQVYQLSTTTGALILDLRDTIKPELHLRDNVHTNQSGANLIARELDSFIDSVRPRYNYYLDQLVSPAYQAYTFDRLAVSCSILSGERLDIGLSDFGPSSELMLRSTIGPYSPVVDVTLIPCSEPPRSFSLLDPWCHFEREMFHSLSVSSPARPFYSTALVRISHSFREPDYSIVRSTAFSYSGPRKISIAQLYSCNCKIENLSQWSVDRLVV